jgi:hypothetical protein
MDVPVVHQHRALAVSLLLTMTACGLLEPEPAQPPSTPRPFVGSAGATAWQSSEDRAPDGFGEGLAEYDSPKALMEALISKARQENGIPDGVQLRAGVYEQRDAAAVIYMQLRGLADDSLVGQEVRLTVRRGADGWFVDGVEYRNHCSRGVDAAHAMCL